MSIDSVWCTSQTDWENYIDTTSVDLEHAHPNFTSVVTNPAVYNVLEQANLVKTAVSAVWVFLPVALGLEQYLPVALGLEQYLPKQLRKVSLMLQIHT